MQQRNLLIFIVLSIVVFVAWSWLGMLLWPPPPPPQPRLALPDARLRASTPALLAPLPAVSPLANAGYLAAQMATSEWVAGERRLWGKPLARKPLKRDLRWASLPGLLDPSASAFAHAGALATQIGWANWIAGDQRSFVRREPEARIVSIGGDDFNLKVDLTSRGAGVQRLVLPAFRQMQPMEGAEWPDRTYSGLPSDPSRELELIPDTEFGAAHRLFHYADPNAAVATANPLDTLGRLQWEVASVRKEEDQHTVVFTANVPGQDVRITKTYTLAKGTYHLGLTLKFENIGTREVIPFRYQLAGAHGLPIEGVWYTYTYRNALVGLVDASGNFVERNEQQSRTIGIQEGGVDIRGTPERRILYAGVTSQFFTSLIVVDNEQEQGVDPNLFAWARPTVEGIPYYDRVDEKPFLDDITVRVNSYVLELKPGQPIVHKLLLYNGPAKVLLLGQMRGDHSVDPELIQRYKDTLHLNTITDYGSIFLWSDLLIQCTNLMHYLIGFLSLFLPNYGLCIIILTVLVRSALFPLSRKQQAQMAKFQEKMAELAPEIKKLEEKYKDPLELHRAKNQLMIERGVNPMAAMGSCWMMFLQLPIFVGLYFALQESIHFRLAPFLWMKNLAAPDMLIWWGENIPWISRPSDQGWILYLGPYFNLLPICFVALMIIQQKIMTPPPTDEQQAMQQSMMKYMMIFFGILFYKVASGLCTYFIFSSLWGLAERKFLPKKEEKKAPEEIVSKKGAAKKPTAKDDDDGKLSRLKEWVADVVDQASKNPKKQRRRKKK
ncbi:MAG: hypothetical protein KatS3mg105_1376 [Gemmatales bacterium]|nr:MAG: hypothetical protein KatS3mg105_1376 [Gemmatales bacterium]